MRGDERFTSTAQRLIHTQENERTRRMHRQAQGGGEGAVYTQTERVRRETHVAVAREISAGDLRVDIIIGASKMFLPTRDTIHRLHAPLVFPSRCRATAMLHSLERTRSSCLDTCFGCWGQRQRRPSPSLPFPIRAWQALAIAAAQSAPPAWGTC